jgi:hypothetical protein
MAMIAAKKGSRPSSSQITINDKIMTINFSAGFFRDNKSLLEKVEYVKLGYDTDTKQIGVGFLIEDDKSGELMKLSYTPTHTAASCPVRSLITSFSLNIKDIAGVYSGDAIDGPTKIDGFADDGFLLKISHREPLEQKAN